jgi:hypothetical protein
MSTSIMQNDKRSYLSGRSDNLHKHHIYYGSCNRKNSEKYGCWVWLTSDEHNMSDIGVHFNKGLDNYLKRTCQIVFEQLYSHERFMQVFGRNYIG